MDQFIRNYAKAVDGINDLNARTGKDFNKYENVNEFKKNFCELKGKNDLEVLKFLMNIYQKCDSSNPNYDPIFDEEMTRIGLRTYAFYNAHNYSDDRDYEINDRQWERRFHR